MVFTPVRYFPETGRVHVVRSCPMPEQRHLLTAWYRSYGFRTLKVWENRDGTVVAYVTRRSA